MYICKKVLDCTCLHLTIKVQYIIKNILFPEYVLHERSRCKIFPSFLKKNEGSILHA